MKIVWKARSQNGRWGAEIVCSTDCPEWQSPSYPAAVRGHLVPLGIVAGITCFRFDRDAAAETWIYPAMGAASPVEGASRAYGASLQGGADATILVLGSLALLRLFGYRGRNSSYYLFRDGVREVAPPALLLALGKIKAEAPPEPIKAPPSLSTAMAEAMLRARRVGG